MTWLALEIGDAATWGSTAVTFCMACFAIAQGVMQRRDMRQQNDLQAEASQLQRRQIETAERRTLVMEQLLMQLSASSRPPEPVAPAQGGYYGAPQGAVPRSAVDESGTADEASEADKGPAAVDTADEEPEWEDTSAVPGPGGWYPGATAGAGYGGYPAPQQQPAPAGAQGPAAGAGAQGQPQGAGSYARPAPANPYGGAAAGQAAPAVVPGAVPWGAPLPAAAVPPPAEWRLERVGRHGFALRNITDRTLEGVRVDRANLPASARGVPENSVVRAGETAEFLMAPERGRPVPDFVLVAWEGRPGTVRVPVPRG